MGLRARHLHVTLFLCLSLAAALPASAGAMGRAHPPSSWVRVAVIQGAQELNVHIKGPHRIVTTKTGEVLGKGKSRRPTIVKPSAAGILLGIDEYKIFGIRIETDYTKAITVNGRNYRGLLEIFREKDLTLTVVNRVGIEEYIYGVLRHEMPPWWPAEALKVQAVIVRTYVSYQRSIRGQKDFDVTGDVLSQVYGGTKGETWRIRRISRATWGEVLNWKGKIFPAYYSSTCGGHTEAARELWNTDIPPLAGRPCEFCTVSKHYVWEKSIPLSLVQKKLRWRKFDVGKIRAVKVLDRTASGRARTLQILHEKGSLKMEAHDLRMIMGPNEIRSTLFDLTHDWFRLYFKGRGWGHGVGLCQWGAYTQARRGTSYEEILAFYYPGAQIVRTDPLPE